MSLSEKTIALRTAVSSLIEGIKDDLGNPVFLEREPTKKAYQALPAIFVQIVRGAFHLLTTNTRAIEVELAVFYIYSAMDAQDRIDKALKAAESIAKQLWSDPSVGGLATGISGDITWAEGPPIDLGESEKFLHTIQVSVTYTLVPFVV